MDELHKLLSILPKNKWLYAVKTQKSIVDWLNANFEITSTDSLAEKIYLFNNNLLQPPKCAHPNCNNLVKWTNNTHYVNCCSRKCSSDLNKINGVSITALLKQQQTYLERYGVDNPQKSPKIRKKTKETNIARYGVDNPQKSKDIRIKTEKTNLERYGCINPLSSLEINEKSKKSLFDNYGVINPSQSPIIQETIKKNYTEKYGVPNHRALHMSNEQYQNFNNKSWLEVELTTKPIIDIARELNVDITSIYNKIREFNLKESTGIPHSLPEYDLINFIKSLGYTDVIHGDRTIIKPKEIDIVIPSAKLAIEYCGLYWHSETYKIDSYHKDKMTTVNAAGYQLLTIFEDEYINSSKIVKNIIMHKLKKTKNKIYARKTSVHEIFDKSAIEDFYNNNHIQGWDKGSTITYGLIYDSTYVAMMSFERYKDNSMYLTRYATSTHVIGGAGKLFKYFLKQNPIITEIISFADLRWSNGNLYDQLGFKLDKIIPPDYQYIIEGEREHKFNYRKKHLKKLFGHQLDTDSLTEKEVMKRMNIPRIWDCGKLRYIWSR